MLKCRESAYCTDNYNGRLAVQNAVNQQCRVGAWQNGASLSWHSRKKSQRNASMGTQWKQGKLAKMWSPPCFVRRDGKDSKEVVSIIFLFCFGVVPFVISCIDISFVTGSSLWLVLVYVFS